MATNISELTLSPDMFDTTRLNVFLFDEQIGQIGEEKCIEPEVVYYSHPISWATSNVGFLSRESALQHLLDVRNVQPRTIPNRDESQLKLF